VSDPGPESASRRDGVVRLEARVRGRVQGVGFRYFARREALRLGVGGWVANREDGSVECIAEGPAEVLQRFLVRLRTGPPGAMVEAVDVQWVPPTGGFDAFAIRSGGHAGD
jgi:acylphosphatase